MAIVLLLLFFFIKKSFLNVGTDYLLFIFVYKKGASIKKKKIETLL